MPAWSRVAASAQETLLSAERLLGGAISDQICRHHRRRLRRRGWERALDGDGVGWASGEPPPRKGNAVEVLIDGAEALPAMAAELAAARSHVHITGWFFSPDFALVREERTVVLRHLLAELAERVDVRVLMWAGAPLPLFRPSRREVRKMRDELTEQARIECGLDSRERPLHCHHEKTIVIDDRVAFVGGIDLTSKAGDRFDGSEHAARATIGWHDVSSRIEGPAVADVGEHFRMRWHEVTGERLEPLSRRTDPVGDIELQIVRTCRSTSTPPSRSATSAFSSRTQARSAARNGSSTWRTSSFGRRRSHGSCAKSSSTHRPLTSGLYWYCLHTRKAATTTRAASSPN